MAEEIREIIAEQYSEREALSRNRFFLNNSVNGSSILILFPGTKSLRQSTQ